jgi:ADP-ribose pyrophosphatase YjhB (NUDIX family)
MDTDRKAGIAIFNSKSTHILLVKQKASSKWGIPKGHLKKTEPTWNGVLRELSEETGLFLQKKFISFYGTTIPC